MVGKSVAKNEEIWAYIKVYSKIGRSLKQIFAEIFAVCRWKNKFDSVLESIKNTPKSGSQSLHVVTKMYQK